MSLLNIFPPTVELAPGDRATFTARASFPPALWANISQGALGTGVVDPNYSVRLTSGLLISADGALQLKDGIGSVEWMLTPNCLPSNAAAFGMRWRFYFDGNTPKAHEYFVYFESDGLSVENTGGVLATLNHIAAIGDRFRVQLSNGFRLYINDSLVHEHLTFASPIRCPATYDVLVNDFVSVQPSTIPAVTLTGNWELRDVVAFTTPTEGDLTNDGPALTTEYFDGEVPGEYKLIATIDPGVDIWVEDDKPAGSVVVGGTGVGWAWGNFTPTAFSGSARLKSPTATGLDQYAFTNATDTFQIDPGDVLYCYVFLDASTPPQEIMLQWSDTASGVDFPHRAYWGANLINFGVDGQPTRRFMGQLPPTGQWVRLEVPANLVDAEGRVFKGMAFTIYDGVCSFDQAGKYPGKLQRAEAAITISPLRVLGPLSRTLQPVETIQLQTNYDVAQTPNLVTWSILSGSGSFSGNQYTASSLPGVTILRASAPGNQVVDLTITVPPIITPSFRAAGPGEQIDFNSNISIMPSFVGAGTMAEGTGAIVPGLPAGIQVNDILLLLVESANESVSTPAGWAVVADSPQGTGTGGGATSTRLSIFWRRATSSESAPTVADPGDHAIAQIFAFRNCITTGNPWDVTSGDTGASSTSVSIPGDTTTVPNCLVVLAVSNQTDSATAQTSGYTNASLANLTERSDVNTTQGNGGGFALITGEKAVAGLYGATTATLANASVQGRISIALRPGVTAWSASGGSINSGSGLWTAPVVTGQTVQITATDGNFTVTAQIQVLPLFPFSDFSLPVSWDRNLDALISMSEDRSSRITREKAPPYDSYPIKLTSRTLTESNTVDAFFDQQGFGKPFILEDLGRGIRKVGWFDSKIAHEARDPSCDIDLAFQFLEARV